MPRFPSYVGLRRDSVVTPAPSTPVAAKASARKAVAVPAPPPPSEGEVITPHFRLRQREDRAVLGGDPAGARGGASLRHVGQHGQTKKQSYASAAEAETAVQEMIADKIDDGFVERGSSPPASAPSVKTAASTPATSTDRSGTRRFEFVDGNSSKFWEVWVTGCQMCTRYGRIGSSGQTTTKDYANEAGAIKAMEKLIGEKTGKGYIEKT